MVNKSSYRKCFSIILLFAVLLILPNSNNGFKLRDLSAHEHEQGDQSKTPKKVSQRNVNGKKLEFRKIVKIVHVSDDGSEVEEETNFKFEKVRKADVDKPEPIFKTIEKEKEKEEDAVAEEATEQLATSAFSILKFFGFGTNDTNEESNSVINWLKSLKKKEMAAEEDTQQPQPDASTDGGWMSYLNRWPFNLALQFDEVESDTSDGKESTNATSERQSDAPISQERFDYLLNRLPSFVLDPSHIEESECKKQLQILSRQLRGQKLWTLQMLDSTGKISSGVLRGNINQFGDFDLCTNIKTNVKVAADQTVRVKGKYCLAHVDLEVVDSGLKLPIHMALGRGLLKSHLDNPSHFVPRYTTANWGVCVPHLCSPNAVRKMLENDLKAFNASGTYFHIQVNERDCYVRRTQSVLHLVSTNWKLGLTLGFYSMFLVIVILGTIFEYRKTLKEFLVRNLSNLLKTSKTDEKDVKTEDDVDTANQEDETNIDAENDSSFKLPTEVLLSFSLKRTTTALFSSNTETDIAAINGLKVLSTFFIYLFLKFLMLGHLPITNRDQLVKILSHPLSIILRTPLIYLDTFLFIGGTLSSYRMCKETEQKSSISVMRRVVGKMLRSLPTLLAVLYFQTWVLPHLGSGPMWSNLVTHNTKLCEQNMWRNFFNIQNAMNLEDTCSPFTIQIAVELQLFLIAPIVVWLYYSNPDLGLWFYGALHALSVAIRYTRTMHDRLSPTIFHGMNVSQIYRTANIAYSSPLHRATPYISGIGMGILLNSLNGSFKLPRGLLWIGWASSIWCLIWSFWYPSHGTSVDFIYDPSEAAPYASWAPLLLSVGLAWIVFISFTKNSPEWMEAVLCSKPLNFLSKISYPMQLISYVVIIYTTAQWKEQTRFDVFELVNMQEILLIIAVATAITIIIDLPMQNLRKILIEFEFPAQPLSIEDEILENRLSLLDDTEEHHTLDHDEPEQDEIESWDSKEKFTQEENWEKDQEEQEEDITYPEMNSRKVYGKYNGNGGYQWTEEQNPDDTETAENWRTESDIEQQDSSNEMNHLSNSNEHDEYEEDEEEEEEDISESDEVIHRPSSEQNFRRRVGDIWGADED